jgi:hypothetical protein
MLTMIIDLSQRSKYQDNNRYRRDEFVLIIRNAYKKMLLKPLPVFGVKYKNLKEFTTTKKDRKRGVTRMPGESMRIDSLYDSQEYLIEPPPQPN